MKRALNNVLPKRMIISEFHTTNKKQIKNERMKKYFILCFVLVVLSIVSCKKEAGEGGNSSIRGSVWVKDFNSAYIVTHEYAGADEYVYIIYGNDISYSERIRTSYDGSFEFKYLQKGNYKIYTYSQDSANIINSSGNFAIVKDVEITENKQVVEVPKITIFKK